MNLKKLLIKFLLMIQFLFLHRYFKIFMYLLNFSEVLREKLFFIKILLDKIIKVIIYYYLCNCILLNI